MDYNQPKLTQEDEKAREEARKFLRLCKNHGRLNKCTTFNLRIAGLWADCCNERGEFVDEKAKPIFNRAMAGDADAIEMFRSLEALTGMIFFDTEPPKSKLNSQTRQRDWYLAKTVKMVMKMNPNYKPTAKRDRFGRPRVSGCCIVTQALESPNIKGIKTVEKALTNSEKWHQEFFRGRKKRSIGVVGLALLTNQTKIVKI